MVAVGDGMPWCVTADRFAVEVGVADDDGFPHSGGDSSGVVGVEGVEDVAVEAALRIRSGGDDPVDTLSGSQPGVDAAGDDGVGCCEGRYGHVGQDSEAGSEVPCSSMSTTRTRRPRAARWAVISAAVVVFVEPPFPKAVRLFIIEGVGLV